MRRLPSAFSEGPAAEEGELRVERGADAVGEAAAAAGARSRVGERAERAGAAGGGGEGAAKARASQTVASTSVLTRAWAAVSFSMSIGSDSFGASHGFDSLIEMV